jgi:trk system potassium uptake protein TrkA
MKILILGCGRVGSTLARLLVQEGQSVTVLDLTSDAFRRLGAKFKGRTFTGTGMDQDVLRKAGIENVDVFVSVTNGDNTNIMAAQLAMCVFKIPRVIARIYDPIRAEAYRDLGVETICTTTIATGLIRSSILQDEHMAPVSLLLKSLDKEYREQITSV